MPIYEFICEGCGCRDERFQWNSDDAVSNGCFNCGAEMRRVFTPPKLLNRAKPGSFRWEPGKLDAWDDRLAHLKDVEEKHGQEGLRKVRSDVGEDLYHETLQHKKARYG